MLGIQIERRMVRKWVFEMAKHFALGIGNWLVLTVRTSIVPTVSLYQLNAKFELSLF